MAETGFGQKRVTPLYEVLVAIIAIDEVFPTVGNTAGGQRLTIERSSWAKIA
jgi:hypothetical protein